MKMIKRAMVVIVSLAVLGCASTPKGPDELDVAIRDTSDYLNDNIPAGNKIVILNIQSDYAALSDYIIDELIANAVNDRVFSVVDRAQLDSIRMEQDFQWSGEVDDNSALEIGKFFGAQTIVNGAIGPLGERYRMTIRALNVQTAEVQGQYNRNISASSTITALMRGGRSTQGSYTRTASSSGSGGTGGSSSGGGLLGVLFPVQSTDSFEEALQGTWVFGFYGQNTFNTSPATPDPSKGRMVISGDTIVLTGSEKPYRSQGDFGNILDGVTYKGYSRNSGMRAEGAQGITYMQMTGGMKPYFDYLIRTRDDGIKILTTLNKSNTGWGDSRDYLNFILQ